MENLSLVSSTFVVCLNEQAMTTFECFHCEASKDEEVYIFVDNVGIKLTTSEYYVVIPFSHSALLDGFTTISNSAFKMNDTNHGHFP